MRILLGDCLEQLKTLPDDSVDSLITDPPAGISFMGKSWDDDKGGRTQWIGWLESVMVEALRVLKPGAHGLVWAIPRTSHWTMTALENAGFEVRDVVTHLFGSGFPKSQNISLAIDKQAGAVREIIGSRPLLGHAKKMKGGNFINAEDREETLVHNFTAPATDEAKKYAGWGTALKPAAEFWILVRKPCSEKTVAANVIKYGTGGINIDASRIGSKGGKANILETLDYQDKSDKNGVRKFGTKNVIHDDTIRGRFPANLVLDEDAAAALDEQSGTLTSGKPGIRRKAHETTSMSGRLSLTNQIEAGFGASRFFYVAKASKRDKGADNTHPTVKSTQLMQYLIKLITPTGGTVLDPFMGSGSTGVACKQLGFDFIGIEREPDYVAIAEKRLKASGL